MEEEQQGRMEENLGELRVRVVKASTRLVVVEDWSIEEEEEGGEDGPKMRRSLSSDGVRGTGMVISSSSGRVQSGGGGGDAAAVDGCRRLGLI